MGLDSTRGPRILHAVTVEDITTQLEREGAFENVPSNLLPLLRDLLRDGQQHEHVALLVGFYSMALRHHLESFGFLVISCDYRHAEGAGMHVLCDVRRILHCRCWTVLVGSPPCRNLTWATACEYERKRTSGEQWFSLSFVVLLYSARAFHIYIELPGSCVAQFLRPPDIAFHPRDLQGGEGEQKFTHLFIVNALTPLLDGSGTGNWQRSHLVQLKDADRREIERARWADATSLAVARAAAHSVVEPGLSVTMSDVADRQSFRELLHEVAGRYSSAGHPLPDGWDDAMAMRPGGDQAREIACDEHGPRHRPTWLP